MFETIQRDAKERLFVHPGVKKATTITSDLFVKVFIPVSLVEFSQTKSEVAAYF